MNFNKWEAWAILSKNTLGKWDVLEIPQRKAAQFPDGGQQLGPHRTGAAESGLFVEAATQSTLKM